MTYKSTHPGPWQAEKIPNDHGIEATHQIIAQTPNGRDTCTVALLGWTENPGSDASLIAAAPDMYGLLRLLRMRHYNPLESQQTDMYNQICGVLNKAESGMYT